MKVAEKIAEQIRQMADGNTFKYQELDISREEYVAATKAIERLVKEGVIRRASTGLFYKPKQTVFGTLNPSEEELLKPYIFEGGKRVAYITGTALYNQMGLTTQVPKNIRLASRDKRIDVKIGNIKVTSIKSYVDISDKNYKILELLDVMKDFKSITDIDKKSAIKYISTRTIDIYDKDKTIEYTLKYPPRVRALAGAILEQIGITDNLNILKDSLNPLSSFDLGLSIDQLPTVQKWNIL